MATVKATAAVLGCTGLLGSHILTTLLDHEAIKTVNTISRRAPKVPEGNPKLAANVETDTTKWAAALSGITPPPDVVFSALGTTRAQAGGIENQWKIDHDLNVELAKASKTAGVKIFVFISSGGTRGILSNQVPYSKMKIGVEDCVYGLDFEQAIILRPGLILGDREVPHTGVPLMSAVVRGLGKINMGIQDRLGQEDVVIARAAVKASLLAREGKAPGKIWVLEQTDIARHGREEWKGVEGEQNAKS